MKRNAITVTILIAGLIMTAIICGCKSTAAAGGVTDPSMPPWINDQPPSDTLWGIGVADNAQMQMRMTMADSRARQDLGRQLSTLVQGMVVDYAREAGSISNTAAMQFQETVSRQIVDTKLSGAVTDVRWNPPKDTKTLWVRLKMSKEDAAKIAADEIQKAIENEASRYAEFKAMDALKMLDQQLQKDHPLPQPVTR